MSEPKHIRFEYDTCPCRECVGNRQKVIEDKNKESMLAEKFGPNWKNIISGMGDQ